MRTRAWRVGSSLALRRSGDSARLRAAWPWPPLRHAAVWASTWVALAAGMGRVDHRGTAVVWWEPPALRQAPRLFVVLGLFMVAGASVGWLVGLVWPPLLGVYAVALVGLCAWARWASWRDRAVAAQLRRAAPKNGWHIHNFAGDAEHRGAGRALLDQVCAEADALGRVLYLDTVVPRLVRYYGDAGFEVVASVEARYAGEAVVVTRMVRRPRSAAG